MEITKDNLEKESSEKAFGYTPGLLVKKEALVRKTRLLPLPGDVLVEKGEKVDFETSVARTVIPGKPLFVKAADILGIKNEDLPPFMVKHVGDTIEKEEIIAKYTPFFGLIKKFVKSPANGVIESISDATGDIVIREPPVSVHVKAYIPGRTIEIIPRMGVIIETHASFIQGIFGIGGERHGELVMAVESIDDELTEEKICSNHKGKILVGGSQITLNALRKAEKQDVCGIIVGGVRGTVLENFLGYKLGVAITGYEDINTTLIVTEGFGKMNMSKSSFNLLKEFEGCEVAINGATQIRAGVIRPEIIIPQEKYFSGVGEMSSQGMRPGALVRITSDPYFGKIGEVINLPVNLQEIETKSKVRVVEVKTDGGNIIVPRANIEIVES